MIERVGLAGHEKKLPAKLSGGQQQRVALARALVFEPRVLLLDEPFSALDKNLRELMQVEVKRLHEETGTTFVFVTHDQSEALALSSRIAIFDHGELLQIGRPQEVYDRPASRFVAEFLGEINLMPLQGLAVERGAAIGSFEDHRLAVPAPGGGTPRGGILAIRPEYLSVGLARPQDAACNAVGATVESATYLGSITRLKLRTGGANSITVSLPGHAAAPILNAGGQVWISWPKDQGFLLPAAEGTAQV
jgi:putative spermidine/putrescine transport system ATP-binding protein